MITEQHTSCDGRGGQAGEASPRAQTLGDGRRVEGKKCLLVDGRLTHSLGENYWCGFVKERGDKNQ